MADKPTEDKPEDTKTTTKKPASNYTKEHEDAIKERGVPTGGPATTELPNGGHGGIQVGVEVES